MNKIFSTDRGQQGLEDDPVVESLASEVQGSDFGAPNPTQMPRGYAACL